MPYLNVKERTLEIKVVYYGAGLSGKTTNLEKVKENSAGDRAGEMMSLNTDGDRTLFFDYLPYELGKFNGCDIKVQLYTVPGQAKYAETRKRVLAGADGVALVLDSAAEALGRNDETVADLRKHLAANGLPAETPVVVQANKRDLPDAMEVDAMLSALGLEHRPCVEAVAVNGVGVFETLKRIVAEVLGNVREAARSGPGAASIRTGDDSGLDGESLRKALVPAADDEGEQPAPSANNEPVAPMESVANDLTMPEVPSAPDFDPIRETGPTAAPSAAPALTNAPSAPLRPSAISVAVPERALSVDGAKTAGNVTASPTGTPCAPRDVGTPALAVAPAPKPVAISASVAASETLAAAARSVKIEEVAAHFVTLEKKVQDSLHRMTERLDEVSKRSSAQLEDQQRAISEQIHSLMGLENRLLAHLRGFKGEIDERIATLNGLEDRLQSNLDTVKGDIETRLSDVVGQQDRLLTQQQAVNSERAVKAAAQLRKLLDTKLTALDARIERIERQNGIIRKATKEGFASIPDTVVKPLTGMGDKIQGAVDKLTTNSGKAHHSMSAALKKIDSSLGALRSTTDETRADMQAVGSRIDGAARTVVENAAAIRSEVAESQHIVIDSANEVLDTMRGGLEDQKASNESWRAEIATMVRDGFSEVRERLDVKKSRWLG